MKNLENDLRFGYILNFLSELSQSYASNQQPSQQYFVNQSFNNNSRSDAGSVRNQGNKLPDLTTNVSDSYAVKYKQTPAVIQLADEPWYNTDV